MARVSKKNKKKSEALLPSSEKDKQLDDTLLSAVAQAELVGKHTGEDARQKAEQIRKIKKKEALKQIQEEEEIIESRENQRIVFEEYKPKFKDGVGFRLIILAIVLACIGLGVGLYFYFINLREETPTAISISQTNFYYSEGDNFTLKAWLNADYEGSNNKIKITTSGASGIISLAKTEVESGESFTVKVVKRDGYAIGGKVRLWVEDAATNKQKAYCDIIIDTPITDLVFEEASNDVYITDTIDVSAVAKTGSIVNDLSTVLGKSVSYKLFVEKIGGNYDATMDEETGVIVGFDEVAEGTGDYSCLAADVNELATLNGTTLAANEYGVVYIEASVNQWMPQNSDATVVKSVKIINNKLIPISSVELNALVSGQAILRSNLTSYKYTVNFSDLIESIESSESEFSQEDLIKMLRYFTSTNSKVTLSATDLVFDFTDIRTDLYNDYTDAVISTTLNYDYNEDDEVDASFVVTITVSDATFDSPT